MAARQAAVINEEICDGAFAGTEAN